MATKKKKETRRCNLSINLSGYELEDIIEDYIKTQIGDVQNMYICVNNNNDNNSNSNNNNKSARSSSPATSGNTYRRLRNKRTSPLSLPSPLPHPTFPRLA